MNTIVEISSASGTDKSVKNLPNSYFVMLLSISIGFAASAPLQQNTILYIPSVLAALSAITYKIIMIKSLKNKENTTANTDI